MNDNAVYGVWLQRAAGAGSRKVPMLLEYFGSCRGVYEADEEQLRLSGVLLPKELPKYLDSSLESAEKIVGECERLGYDIITPDDEKYPDRLKNIPDYPAALYICGSLPDIDDEVCIAMVGTRRASRYGYTIATELAKDLAACGAVIISGGARGIDTASHQGALLSGGKTIAVLGCGINTRYNTENEGLRKVISTSGALVSEYPPGSPPLGYHFPIRNRLISALSLGVIVVEAGAQSGSLITANIALEQGKDIFSVPGELGNYLAKGTNRLIFDGATPIETAADVLNEYAGKFPHRIISANLENINSRVYEKHVRPKWDKRAFAEKMKDDPDVFPEKPRKKAFADGKRKRKEQTEATAQNAPEQSAPSVSEEDLSDNARKVLGALKGTSMNYQELLAEIGMDPSELSRCLTELELSAAVTLLPGNKFTAD